MNPTRARAHSQKLFLRILPAIKDLQKEKSNFVPAETLFLLFKHTHTHTHKHCLPIYIIQNFNDPRDIKCYHNFYTTNNNQKLKMDKKKRNETKKNVRKVLPLPVNVNRRRRCITLWIMAFWGKLILDSLHVETMLFQQVCVSNERLIANSFIQHPHQRSDVFFVLRYNVFGSHFGCNWKTKNENLVHTHTHTHQSDEWVKPSHQVLLLTQV